MKRLLTIIGAITLFCGIVHAQQFPVQVTPQLLPPYSVKVSDYYSPGVAGAKLNILLLLRDFNKPQLQVRLRMTIEGQSVALRSREDAVFTPITIESGNPVYIDPSDLAQYFNPDNLDFSGITRQQYEQTGKLPEGFYTFCFEAIETSTNQSVSNRGCTFAWMTLNEPPILNLPRKAEGVIPVNPQNLIFQWTPRHTASPTAGYVTDYVFSIVEMNDNVIAPEAAFLSNEPLYIDSVTTTTYLYHVGLPSLIEGKKYAWRVQAKAKNGIQDLATFRNQGYSETSWFTYQNTCAVPSGISASPQGQRVGIEWNSNPVHLEYKVEYREANNADAVWFEIGNTLPRVSVADLRPNTNYEYRVGGACEYGRFTFGNLMLFTTNDSNVSMVANCGTDPGFTDPPLTLVQTFPIGDTIHAGDYDVIVTSITGQTSFSGEGFVKMSWLGDANVAVRFTNVGINTEKQLASGVIETTYDPTEAAIADVDEVFETFTKIMGALKELKNAVNGIVDSNNFDVNKIADYSVELAQLQPSFISNLDDENLKQVSNAYFQNLNTALMALVNKESCQCATTSGSDGGGDFFRFKFIYEDFECCKQAIIDNIEKLQDIGLQAESDKADNNNVVGNYLPKRGIYISPICTPVLLPEGAKILKSCSYSEALELKLLRFEIPEGSSPKIYEAQIIDNKFYGYKTVSGESYEMSTNPADYPSDENPEVYGIEQKGMGQNVIIRQRKWRLFGGFSLDNLQHLSSGVAVVTWCGLDESQKGYSDASTVGICSEATKSTGFTFSNGITKGIYKTNIDALISSSSGLKNWLATKNVNAEIFIHKSGSSTVKHYSKTKDESYNGDAATAVAKDNFLLGKFESDFSVWLEFDETTGKVKVYQKFRKDYLNPVEEYANNLSAQWFEERIISKINKKISSVDFNEEYMIKAETVPGAIPEDGQYRTDELNFIKWICFAGVEMGYVVNNAQLNGRLWNDIDNSAEYNASPMNFQAPLAGVGDQTMREIKDLYQLVELAGDCIEDPAIVRKLYDQVKELSFDKIKQIITDQVNDKIVEYNKGGTVRQYHITRDGIVVIKTIIAGPIIVGKIKDVIEKGGDILQGLKKFMAEISDEGIKTKISNLSSASKSRFVDFITHVEEDVRNVFKTNPKGIDAWSKFDAGDFDEMENILEAAEDALTADQKLLKEAYEALDEFDKNNLWPQDAAYRIKKGNARPALDWRGRKVGGSDLQNQAVQDFCSKLEAAGVNNIRINQAQCSGDLNPKALGINRPDIQFTFKGKKYYVELDRRSSSRAEPHKQRLFQNDLDAKSRKDIVDPELKGLSINVEGQVLKLDGSVTLWTID